MMQQTIFACESPRISYPLRAGRRQVLAGGAWVDYAPNWVLGHEALYRELEAGVRWEARRRRMYERTVAVPRLTGGPPTTCFAARFLKDIAARLSSHYATALERIALAWYRDGRDSVAMHGDKMGSLVDDCIVAIVAVGAPRRFHLREVDGPGASTFEVGWGDLLVMGGSCQRTWRHGIPKVARAEPRISIMFRPALPGA